MIRAVCFNRHSFRSDTLRRICTETCGRLAGCLTDPSMANCIESFPDDSIYLSFISGRIPAHVYDCKGDIDRFIQVNNRINRK